MQAKWRDENCKCLLSAKKKKGEIHDIKHGNSMAVPVMKMDWNKTERLLFNCKNEVSKCRFFENMNIYQDFQEKKSNSSHNVKTNTKLNNSINNSFVKMQWLPCRRLRTDKDTETNNEPANDIIIPNVLRSA